MDVCTKITHLNHADAPGATQPPNRCLRVLLIRAPIVEPRGHQCPPPEGSMLFVTSCTGSGVTKAVIEVRGRRLAILKHLCRAVCDRCFMLLSPFNFYHHPYRLIFIIPILKMRKLSHRKVKKNKPGRKYVKASPASVTGTDSIQNNLIIPVQIENSHIF